MIADDIISIIELKRCEVSVRHGSHNYIFTKHLSYTVTRLQLAVVDLDGTVRRRRIFISTTTLDEIVDFIYNYESQYTPTVECSREALLTKTTTALSAWVTRAGSDT